MQTPTTQKIEAELKSAIKGRIVFPGDPDYDVCRKIWNGAVDRYPSAIIYCRDVIDVQSGVRIAGIHHVPFSVRGGGHDWAGRSLIDGGVVVDLSEMRQVVVDPQRDVARVGGGATTSDLIAAAAPHGLVAATGTIGAVGIAGLSIGGGYGPLMCKYGLAADNIISAELVLSDGQIVEADDLSNSDLFWAIRGGGGNFGVVTALTIRLHRVDEVLGGVIIYDWSEAKKVFENYSDIASTFPDELGVVAGVFAGHTGEPVVMIVPIWSGAAVDGKAIIAKLENLGTPVLSQVGSMPYKELLKLFDATVVDGRHYSIKTRSLPSLSYEAIAAIVDAGGLRSSPHSVIATHHFRGRATQVPVGSTAFGTRQEHFLVEIVGAWDGEETSSDDHCAWVTSLWSKLEKCALPGGYPNLIGPESSEQAESAYSTNALKLLTVKSHYDPANFFRSAISLPRHALPDSGSEAV